MNVLALAVYERNTAKVILNTGKKVFTALCSNRHSKIIGFSTDGKCKMNAQVSGVATRFQQVAMSGFFRVCYRAVQLDVLLQNACSAVSDELFYKNVTSLVFHLRHRFSLMWTKVPIVADIRWESMHHVSYWFKNHCVDIVDHL